jgi:hypothetical protein
VRTFFGFENNSRLPHPIIELLLLWLHDSSAPSESKTLLAGTSLAVGFNLQAYYRVLYNRFQDEYDSLKTYIVNINIEISNLAEDSKRRKVLEFYRESLLETDIVTYLINLSLLPKYGFPTNVVALNTINKRTKVQGHANEETKKRFRLQRSGDIAIREYAPGTEIIAGKRLLKSAGITFSTNFGGEAFNDKPTLEQRAFVEC